METYSALKAADEVRTFPSIAMPAPVFKIHTGKTNFSRTKDLISERKDLPEGRTLPGLLKTKKSNISTAPSSERVNIFTGQDLVHLKLDANTTLATAYDETKGTLPISSARKGLSTVDMSEVLTNPIHSLTNIPMATMPVSLKPVTKRDPPVEELRNYLVLMDKHSLHNFLIYEGRTLKETPEYQSFQREYQFRWGSIASIIYQLEDLLSKNEVKLAIINGPRLYELAKLNLPVLTREDLFQCIANVEQVESMLDMGDAMRGKRMVKVITRFQAYIRRFLCMTRFKKLKKMVAGAIKIQSIIRMALQRIHYYEMKQAISLQYEQSWTSHREKLRAWWGMQNNSPETTSRKRLIIYLPSISMPQYIRLDLDNYRTLQNAHVSNFQMLADPDIEVLYVCPLQMSSYQVAYHEKLLSLLGISTLPRRLNIITPEISDNLPHHLTLSQQLWTSRGALKKIKNNLRRHKVAMLIPASIGWAEKRLSHILNVPLLGPQPSVAETLSSRSFLKSFFMESSVNVPIGAHDIFTMEDLMIALTRLIASNLAVIRWIIRLNYDNNNESCVILDSEKLSIIPILRQEQQQLLMGRDSLAPWYARHVQLAARKRILNTLKKEFLQKIHFGRKDIYTSWDNYQKLMKSYGCVVEAEPIEVLGYLVSNSFIDPLGGSFWIGGAQKFVDDNYQMQSYAFPQDLIPTTALESVTGVLLQKLFEKFDVIGYVSIYFTVYWDAQDQQPRIVGTDISFGNSPLIGAIGTAAIVTSPETPEMPLSLTPVLPEDRYFVYVPIATHDPLKSTHDDMFFKLCRIRGIAFDTQNKVGSLFFLSDTILTGSVSILCCSKTRLKSLELGASTLSFVQKNYGLDVDVNRAKRSDNLSKILISLKKAIKAESNKPLDNFLKSRSESISRIGSRNDHEWESKKYSLVPERR